MAELADPKVSPYWSGWRMPWRGAWLRVPSSRWWFLRLRILQVGEDGQPW